MQTSSYDLVVLGDDLAGLVAAALAARRGLRTLVLGGGGPGRYALGPHKLPTAPMVVPGGLTGGAIERAVRELNLEHVLKRRLRDSRPALQLIGPDQRIDVGGGAEALAREVARELPGAEGEALRAAWDGAAEVSAVAEPLLAGTDGFPGVGFWQRRRVRRAAAAAQGLAQAWWATAERALAGSPALALLRLPAAVGDACVEPSPLAVARALTRWRAGAPAVRGELDGLVELLAERVTSASGELRPAGIPVELATRWWAITGLRTAAGEELGVGQLVAAVPAGAVAALLEAGGRAAPRGLAALASARPAAFRYVLNLVVEPAGIPEGLGQTALVVVDPARPLVGANAFSLHLGEPDERGRVVVTVAALLPAEDAGPDDATRLAAARALRPELLANLDRVMPFVERHVVLAHSPHDGAPPHAPGGRGSHEPPRGLPLPMPPAWRADAADGAGVGGAPYAPALRNLTLASSQVVAQLGLEGSLVAGWSAAQRVCGRSRRARPVLARDALPAP